MAPSSKTGSRLMAVTGCAAACFFAASAFLNGGGVSNGALRGQEVQYTRFAQQQPLDQVEAPKAWSSAMAAVAAFALVAGLVTPAAKAAPMMSSARATQVVAVTDSSSMNIAMKQYVNPSDEFDPDEQPFEDWTSEHPVQFVLTGLIPVFIYLTFYILGSLEII